MATRAAKRFSVKTDASVFKRLGSRVNQENITRNHQVKPVVCKYWLQGRCVKNPCRFLHPNDSKSETLKSKYAWKNPSTLKSENSPPIEKAHRTVLKNNKVVNAQNQIVRKPEQKLLKSEVNVGQSKTEVNVSQSQSQSQSIEKTPKLCCYWAIEKCTKGEKCENLHSWFYGDGLSMVAQLKGHTKAVTGIALPSGSNKLFCGSKDKSLRVWDCSNGLCGIVVDFDNECGTLVNEGSWIFVGLRDMIKAWNLDTQQEIIIQASGGQVNAITMFEDVLFAGMEDGSVLAWKSTENGFSELSTSLKGHTGSVLSLVVGAKRLFSGSSDQTIRVWDTESLKCMQVLKGHTSDVTTVLLWDQYLLSGSLDKKIKVWAATENGNIEECYQHDLDSGVVAFCGMMDTEKQPILLCSCKDNSVRLYDLPSFVERGRVFSRMNIQAIEKGPDGLFFTGDAAGSVSVWKLNG